MQAHPALVQREDRVVRATTTVGGLGGFLVALAIIAVEVW